MFCLNASLGLHVKETIRLNVHGAFYIKPQPNELSRASDLPANPLNVALPSLFTVTVS